MRTDRWIKTLRIGRFQIEVRLFCHHYSTGPDRWVLQSSFVYDRKGVSF